MEETFGQQMGLEETLSGAMRYSQCSALPFASPGGVGWVAFWGLVTSCCPCRTSSPPLQSAWARLLGHMYSFPPAWDQTFGLVNAVLRNSLLIYSSIIHLCICKNINYLMNLKQLHTLLHQPFSWVMNKQKRRWKTLGIKGSSFPKRGRTEGEETSQNNCHYFTPQ